MGSRLRLPGQHQQMYAMPSEATLPSGDMMHDELISSGPHQGHTSTSGFKWLAIALGLLLLGAILGLSIASLVKVNSVGSAVGASSAGAEVANNGNCLPCNAGRCSGWRRVIDEQFSDATLDTRIWRVEADDSTGGGHSSLQAYSGIAPGGIKTISVVHGQLNIISTPQWYVQPFGQKGLETFGPPPPKQRVVRPYISGRIDTLGKVTIDMGKPGKIEFKYRLDNGTGLWPAIWMYPTNPQFGGWSASGELDLLEIWRKPDNSNPRFNNNPSYHLWFGGTAPYNAFLGGNPTASGPRDGSHVVEFEWDGQGTFVWKLDGLIDLLVGPRQALNRPVSSPQTPLSTLNYTFPLASTPAMLAMPYQGVYVGHPNGTDMVIEATSPAPFVSSNPFYLIIELQTGGAAPTFSDIYPDDVAAWNAYNSVNISHEPLGLMSESRAAALGLPTRCPAFYTTPQRLYVDYITYSVPCGAT